MSIHGRLKWYHVAHATELKIDSTSNVTLYVSNWVLYCDDQLQEGLRLKAIQPIRPFE